MSTTLPPSEATEEKLVSLVNRVRCGNCDIAREVDSDEVDEMTTVDDLWDLAMVCCEDPVPNPSIQQDRPLFGISEIDDDYHRPEKWTYEVDDTLIDAVKAARS